MAVLVRGTFCPRCKNLLYRIERTADSERWSKAADSPDIERDDKGHFMTCRRCSSRIGMRRSSSTPGWDFEVVR